jgi:hypothetical protein
MDEKKIGVIGHANTGLTEAIKAQLRVLDFDVCVIDNSEFINLREPDHRKFSDLRKLVDSFSLITVLPELKEPWIDPKEHVVNYGKHMQTCLKNRKKRKNRRRKGI